MIFMDFETRSQYDIKHGASRYSQEAEVLCLAYSIDEGPVKLWQPRDPDPEDLFEAIAKGEQVYAHNASFEQAIWQRICVEKWHWPEIKEDQWNCTMSECYARGLPGSLGEAGKALGLTVKKDDAGRRLMLKMAKPRKPTKNDASLWHDSPEDRKKLGDYCKQDVLAEMAIHGKVPRLPGRETKVYRFDMRVNRRGVLIDQELARSAVIVWAEHCEYLTAKLRKITDGEVQEAKQVAKMIKWLEGENVDVTELDASTVSQQLLRSDLSDKAREVLTIRKELALSSVSKYEKMLACIEKDGRVRGCFQYHGAQTGRWAGRLIQLQNLPRGKIKPDQIEEYVKLVKTRDIGNIMLFSDLSLGDILSSLIRPTIIAPPDKKFIVCDFAGVEARGLAWAAHEKWLLDAFRNGDDIYKEMASSIYGVPVDEVTKDQRFVGKTCLTGNTQVFVLTPYGEVTTKPLVTVSITDRVWDGENWVLHDGVVCQGFKEVIKAWGVEATADHLVMSKEDKWEEWHTFCPKDSPRSFAVVWDIANAGPNYRFTVANDLGGMLVHNCILGSGYQLGASGFQRSLANYGVTMPLTFCEQVIEAYREKNSATRRLWYALEGAAKTAVDEKTKRTTAGPYKFYMDGEWLCIRLPAGRDICYYQPKLIEGKFGKQIEYTGVDIAGRPKRETTYGGKLAENVTQALCRDLLVDAMSRLEKLGYEVVAHIHDEIVCESKNGSIEEMEEVMKQVPQWATWKGEQFPIGCEGYETDFGGRYRK